MQKKDFRIAVVTVSDRSFAGEREDASGPELIRYLESNGYSCADYTIVSDDAEPLRNILLELCDKREMDLVLTTGGTGLAERDITPETTKDIATKDVPGISEAIRAYSLTKTKHAMLSRGVSVLRNRTLIINFPGSPKACRESMDVIIDALPHALGLLRGEKVDA